MKILSTVVQLQHQYPKMMFTGSLGLFLLGDTARVPKDIDVVCDPKTLLENGIKLNTEIHSGSLFDENGQAKCAFKFNGFTVDVFDRIIINPITVDLLGTPIRVTPSIYTINSKLSYIRNLVQILEEELQGKPVTHYNLDALGKHVSDVEYYFNKIKSNQLIW